MTLDEAISSGKTITRPNTQTGTSGGSGTLKLSDVLKGGHTITKGGSTNTDNPSGADIASQQQSNPTFPARSTNEGFLSGMAKTVGNIPSSAVNFGKNVASFFNPMRIAKDTATAAGEVGQAISESPNKLKDVGTLAKATPAAAYETLVPEFFKNVGGFIMETDPNKKEQARQKALDSIVNDPVGQLAPVLMTIKGLMDTGGMGAKFDEAVKKVTAPVKKVASAPFKAVGAVSKAALGVASGAGYSSISSALGASDEFTSAMRGKTTPEDIVNIANKARSAVVKNRGDEYVANLKKVEEGYRVTNMTPKQGKGIIMQSNKTGETFQLSTQGVKSIATQALSDIGVSRLKSGLPDLSQRPSLDARGITKVENTISNWNDMTPKGLNQLRQEVEGFKKGGVNLSPSDGRFNHYIDSITNGIRNYLGRVPEIGAMNKTYAEQSQFLTELKSGTGLGGKINYDTAFTKLTGALKKDSGFKREMLNELEQRSGSRNLNDYIAGANLSGFSPKGTVGSLVDAGAAFMLIRGVFNPSEIPVLAATSPRLVGEFLRGLGVASQNVSKFTVALKTLASKKGLEYVSNLNTAQENTKSISAGLKNTNSTNPSPNL